MSEIDDVLSESMRRRAAEARLGGSSMADVQHRVVRRRRRLATITCAGLAVPALLGIGIAIGRDTSQSNGVVSAGAAADAGDTTLPGTPNVAAACEVLAPPTLDTGPVTTIDATRQISSRCVTVGSAAGGSFCAYTATSSSDATLVPPDLSPIPTAPATFPPNTVPGAAVPPTTYAPMPSCPQPPECADVSTGSGTVSIVGSVDVVPAGQPQVIAGSVPPGAPTSTWPEIITSSSGCGISGPTTWRCQDEIPVSVPAVDTWREFTTCEPMFSGGPPTSMEVTTTTNPSYPPSTATTVEPNIASIPTSTIPVDPPITSIP